MNQLFPAQPVAMISGGLGDIGKAAAHAMQRSGCRVSIGDVHPTSLADGGVHYYQVDASNEASVVAWFDAVESHFGQTASVIVANAAIVTIGSVMTATVEEWNRTMHVNLTGAWLTARTGAQRMLAAGLPGRIVFNNRIDIINSIWCCSATAYIFAKIIKYFNYHLIIFRFMADSII